MTERYADTDHVIESLRACIEHCPEDEGRLTVVDLPRARVVAETAGRMDGRNLWGSVDHRIDSQVCSIDWSQSGYGITLELSFHEDSVEKELCLTPAGPRAICANQATSPLSLGEKLEAALRPLEREHGAMFTFKGVQAASVAHGGHYTDFEYEYSIDGVTGLP